MEFLDNAIRALVERIIGSPGIKLYEVLDDKENLSEFKIADDMKMGINQVRSLLYKLSSYNLVYSTRKKDRQKGWYVYFWTFNKKYAKGYLIMDNIERIRKLTKTLRKEKDGNFYLCSNKCIRMDLSEAMEHNFKCPECEKVVEFQDNAKRLKDIEEEINTLQQNTELLKQSIVPELPSERKERKALAKKARDMIRKKSPPKKKGKKKAGKKKFKKIFKPKKPHKKKFIPKHKKKQKKNKHHKFKKRPFRERHVEKKKKWKINRLAPKSRYPQKKRKHFSQRKKTYTETPQAHPQPKQEKKSGFFKKLKKIRF